MKYNRENALKGIIKSEDKLAAAKLLDKADFTARTHKLAHSDFLDPRQLRMAQRVLDSAGICRYICYGGYSGAERSVVIFVPDIMQADELEEYKKRIFSIIEITPLARDRLTHRDYLGALMSLGIRRDVTGDIVIDDEKSSIIVLSDIAAYISGNLNKVGNTGISIKISDIMELFVQETEAVQIKAVVSALRLDCVCASAFGLSRSRASEHIKSGKVQLNWETSQAADKLVKEGDTLSMRGKGRAVLERAGGRTRKDRIAIIIRKYM